MPRPGRDGRAHGSQLVAVVVVDYDAAEVGDGFDQFLEALVPVGGGFEEEHDSLVGEAELEVAELADVVDQVFGVVDLRGRRLGEGLVAELLSRMAMSDFSSTTSLMVTKGAPAALACSTKSFQASGSSSSKITEGTSSLTYPLKRRMPWPEINATMSSLSEMRLSGCIERVLSQKTGLRRRCSEMWTSRKPGGLALL